MNSRGCVSKNKAKNIRQINHKHSVGRGLEKQD